MATTKSSTIKRYNGTDYDTINPITTGQNVYGSGTNASTPLVNNSDLIDAAYTKEVQVDTIKARTSSSASTYGPGSSSQVLKSNGTYAYWGSDSSNTTECAIGANFKLKNPIAGYQVFITNNENKLVPMVSGASGTSSTGTSKTMNTESFNPFGLIAYTSSSSYRAADALCSSSTYVSYSSFDLRYAFNCGSTLTANSPLYIVAAMQSDGQAKLTSPYYSQTLPSSADGKIYIYLGQAVSTTNITMQQIHPVFEYIDGGLKVLPYDSNVVKLSGNQTIAGTKTFTSRPQLSVTTRLPNTYQEIKYIGATGSQYIDTGFKTTSEKLKVEFGCSFPNGIAGQSLMGSNSPYNLVPWGNGNNTIAHWVGNSGGIMSVTYSNSYNDVTYELNNGAISCTINGDTTSSTYSGSIQNNYNFYIFGKNNGGNSSERGSGYNLYYMKIYNNDVLVRNLVPCYRISDNVIGLYDLVNSTFYTNAGSGTFNKGANVTSSDFTVEDDFSTVAFSGNYNDLTNKPSTSNFVTLDGTQTITGKKTFSSGATALDICLSSQSDSSSSGSDGMLENIEGELWFNGSAVGSGGGGGGSTDIPVTSASGSSQQLARNTFYNFGDRGTTSGETVTITLGSAVSGVVNEYMGEILVDEYPLTLSTPSTITWAESDGVANASNTLTLEAKYTYQFNIIRNLGLIVRFPNGVLDKPNPTITGTIISWSAIPNATDYKVVGGLFDDYSATTTDTAYNLATWYPTLGTLSTPTNLTASAGSGSSYTITLTWDSVSNASTYTVYYKTSSASSYSSTNVSTNTATLTNLQEATTYNLYVKANSVTGTAMIRVTAQSTHYVNTTSDNKSYSYTKYNASSNSSIVNCTTVSGG